MLLIGSSHPAKLTVRLLEVFWELVLDGVENVSSLSLGCFSESLRIRSNIDMGLGKSDSIVSLPFKNVFSSSILAARNFSALFC